MERSEALELLQAQLAEVLDVDRATIVPDARLNETLGADSVDLIEVAGVIERRFDVAIDDRELHDLQTVDDFVTLVVGKLA